MVCFGIFCRGQLTGIDHRQLEVFLAGNRMADRTFREKNKNIVESFSTLFFMSTLKSIKEKERERVIKKKGDDFSWKKKLKISKRQ